MVLERYQQRELNAFIIGKSTIFNQLNLYIMAKVKMSIGFKKFKSTRFKDIETAIFWVRKKKISNVQIKQCGNEWDNF